jgi:hypothetical protein
VPNEPDLKDLKDREFNTYAEIASLRRGSTS